jgi:hypothetical protein
VDDTASRGDEAPPKAHVVHRTARRMRLRVPSKRHDPGFFAALEERLSQIPKIEAALANPRTASILLRFADGDGDAINAAIDALEILSMEQHGKDRARRLDALAPGNAGRVLPAGIDRRAVAFTVLVLLLIRRLLRGGYLAPALALVWLIYEVWRARHTDMVRT